MLSFILRRLLTLIPLLLAVTLLASVLMYISPGDILTKMRAQPDIPKETVTQLEQSLGLVDSEGEPTRWYVRYGHWLGNVLQGDFGESITYRIPVFQLISQRAGATFILSLTSILFAWCIAVPLGVLAAIYKDSIFDKISALLAYAALSIPEFFLAILAVYFAAVTGLFPVGGRSSIGSEFYPFAGQLADYAYHLILPTIVLGIGSIAGMMRIMRANFIDYREQGFVTTARAKGLPEKVVMFKHVLRNAINPLISYLGFAFSSLLSGALLVENVMNYPGLGQLIYQALLEEDEYVVMAALMISVVMLVIGNLLADIALAWSDPRIRLEGKGGGRGIPPLRLALICILIVAMIGYEIVIEWAMPDIIPILLAGLKWGAIYLGALIALGCLTMVGYIVFMLARKLFWQIVRRPMGAASLGTLAVLYFGAIFANFLAPYPMNRQNLVQSFHPPTKIFFGEGGLRVQAYELEDPAIRSYVPAEGKSYPLKFFVPSDKHKLWGFIPLEHRFFGVDSEDPTARVYLLGSDSTGRDVFSRLLYGGQISLSIGVIGISITLTLGFIVGGLAGYFGGAFDFLSMRVVEFLMSIPALYLLLALRSALFQPGFTPTQVYLAIVIILSIIGWAGAARVIRGMSLSISGRPFVTAAESMGQRPLAILGKHVLPNLASYLLVAATLAIPGYILAEAALSFLGLGITEPSASWGLMLQQSQKDMKVLFLDYWWLITPGIAIFITVIAFNVLGDVLRDIVDPKMKKQ